MLMSKQNALYFRAMAWVIVGLGNPGGEHEDTRHNTGRVVVEGFAELHKFGEWKTDNKAKALISRGAIDKSLVLAVLPETFMNKSGAAVSKYVKSAKAAERLVVVYDDLDLPLGEMKISYDRGSGGHKGVESITRTLKTKKFYRLRVGISPSTASGILKKPTGEKEVVDFILGKWKAHELDQLKKLFKKAAPALERVIVDGAARAMNEFN